VHRDLRRHLRPVYLLALGGNVGRLDGEFGELEGGSPRLCVGLGGRGRAHAVGGRDCLLIGVGEGGEQEEGRRRKLGEEVHDDRVP